MVWLNRAMVRAWWVNLVDLLTLSLFLALNWTQNPRKAHINCQPYENQKYNHVDSNYEHESFAMWHTHKHNTPTIQPSIECITNINDVIWFDFVTISGCRRHRRNNNNNQSIQTHTVQRRKVYPFFIVRLYWFERFFFSCCDWYCLYTKRNETESCRFTIYNSLQSKR